jgi:hypothetical protein
MIYDLMQSYLPPDPKPSSEPRGKSEAQPTSDRTLDRADASSSGRCLCGAITVTVQGMDFTDGTPRGHLCHCATCRRSTGTDYAHNLRLPADQLEIGGAENLVQYAGVHKDSGVAFKRAFCKTCGSTITSTSAPLEAKGDTVVRMGLFPTIPDPASEMCADEKVAWLRDKLPAL